MPANAALRDYLLTRRSVGIAFLREPGPAVAELNASIGFAPDPQQELGLDMIFAVGENGLPACFAFCAIS